MRGIEAAEMETKNRTNSGVGNASHALRKKQGHIATIPEAFRLGEILVATNVITREELEDVLTRQKFSQSKKLGELLQEAGYAQSHQVDLGLEIQKKLLAAALATAISLSPVSASHCTELQAAHSCSAKINVTANVIAVASVKILRQMSQVVVATADVARGYVDVRSASLIEVKNNSRDGFLLIFQFLGDAFKEVCVYGLGNEVQISLGGGWILQQHTNGILKVELSYRLVLEGNFLPGTYAWPLLISVQPM